MDVSTSHSPPVHHAFGLSVVIPAYNEEQRLRPTLESVSSFLIARGQDFEILVVDDGSTDGTASEALTYADQGVRVVSLGRNQGKGAAVRRGVLESRGETVLLCDADLSTPIEDLAKLEVHLGEAELILGSRAVEESDVAVHQPIYRELMGKIFNRLIRLGGVDGIRDTQCGFKLLRGDVARELFESMVTPGFAFDVELVWLARRSGHRVAEVGVTWRDAPGSSVNPLLDPPKMLLEIARFRWKHRARK
ncbi:MAG: glycosyltransferase family 2 protein [Thermoanaerobaculia bacterium]|nr:glycosyltransferase family 2 protein [Thermoanaerobaculia bacterium]